MNESGSKKLNKPTGLSGAPAQQGAGAHHGAESGSGAATLPGAARHGAATRHMLDFTTGSIPRHILVFSWPMFVGNLLQAMYNTVDSFWVGRYLGPAALGAVSVSFPIIFALVAVIIGLTMATTTMVAQYRGAGDDAQVKRTVANSLTAITALGLVSTVVGIALRTRILSWIQTPPEILEPAALYLGTFLVGLVPMFLFNLFASILRGLGDSRSPLRYLAFATILNIVLDPIMIFGVGPVPAMGIRGVAWATVISQTLATVLLFVQMTRHTDLLPKSRDSWRVDGRLIVRMFRIGIPAGLQSIIVSFSMIILAAIVNGFGPAVVAAFGAAARLDQFAFMPALTVSFAVTALVGQNLGAGKKERVKEIVLWSVVLTGLITAVVTAIVIVAPAPLLRVFTGDPTVLQEGAAYLRIVGLSYVPLAVMFTITGVLRGAGDTVTSMIISFVTLWLVRLPLATFLASGMGINGVWTSITVSTALGAILNYAYYLTGRWKKFVIIGRP